MGDFYSNDEENFNYTYDYDYEHTICDKEDVRSFAGVFLPIIYSLALVVGVAGNTLVVVVYTLKVRLRTLTDMCLVNLAISDLLLLFTLPFWAANAVHGWRLGSVACKITSFLYSTNFGCGMLLLACISVDRYCSVTRSPTYRTGTSLQVRRRWLLVCLVLWAVASFLGLPELIFSTVKHSHHRMSCTSIYPPHMALPVKAALELMEVALRFLVPFVVMVVCYCCVGRVLSRVPGVQRDRKWRALRVLLAVVAIFLLTQLPYNVVKLCRAMDMIYMLVTDCDVSKNLDQALQVTEVLALAHACINPVVYAFMGSSFRGHVLKVAKLLGQRLGRHPKDTNEEPAVEIALKAYSQTQTQSDSEQEDTSNFTI